MLTWLDIIDVLTNGDITKEAALFDLPIYQTLNKLKYLKVKAKKMKQKNL